MPEPKRPLKVFLCHASTDKPKVRELYRYLKRRGINPWFDEEHLVGGQDWQVEIPKALGTSDAIIICLTKNSIDKEGYVQNEIKFALDKALSMPEGRIFLIPVKFEECEVPFSLSRYQWVDLTVESGYAKMMKALKFRASQLERSTVEVSKKDVEEENPTREKKEREAVEHAERERKEKKIREFSASQASEKAKRTNEEKEVKSVPVKPKTGGQIAYWFGGVVVLALGIVFLSTLNNPPSTEQPTPENTQTPKIATLVEDTIEPSVTATPKSTSIPANTLTPTPLPTEIADAKGVSMVLVPAGEFTMGSNNGLSNEQPVHQVYLDEFYIDKFEVSNGHYKDCVNANVCQLPIFTNSLTRPDYFLNSEYDNYPVIFVNWNMANDYCSWRGAKLPTEAQWEKAARGIDGRKYPWGNVFDETKGNICDVGCPEDFADKSLDDGYIDTSPIGSYESGKSPYGVYDMAGNVWEWVADWYSDNYYKNSSLFNPLGSTLGESRVLRGSAWNYFYDYARSSARYWNLPLNSYSTVGFRCASDANP